jgi:hypothetical protein
VLHHRKLYFMLAWHVMRPNTKGVMAAAIRSAFFIAGLHEEKVAESWP